MYYHTKLSKFYKNDFVILEPFIKYIKSIYKSAISAKLHFLYPLLLSSLPQAARFRQSIRLNDLYEQFKIVIFTFLEFNIP